MLGGGSEVPENGLVILRKQGEAVGLVLSPGADVRRSEVAHIVHVETQQRAHRGLGEEVFGFLQAFAAQPLEVDAVLPIDRHGSMSFESHKSAPRLVAISYPDPRARRPRDSRRDAGTIMFCRTFFGRLGILILLLA